MVVPTRRERLHRDTSREIVETGRRLLASGGAEAITLRAIGREMGTTAPALYRYFANREDLLQHVVSDVYDELTARIRAAGEGEPDLSRRILATCRAFRNWARANERQYAMILGTPLEAIDHNSNEMTSAAAQRFGSVFVELFIELWHRSPFPISADEDIEPVLRRQLAEFCERDGLEMPLGTVLVFLHCWERLQGCISQEAFGHFYFALPDGEAFFEDMLRELSEAVGIDYRPPEAA